MKQSLLRAGEEELRGEAEQAESARPEEALAAQAHGDGDGGRQRGQRARAGPRAARGPWGDPQRAGHGTLHAGAHLLIPSSVTSAVRACVATSGESAKYNLGYPLQVYLSRAWSILARLVTFPSHVAGA